MNYIPYITKDFKLALLKMKKSKANFLILDLTRNPGGFSSLADPLLYLMYGYHSFSNKKDWVYVRKISNLLMNKYQTNIENYNKKHNTKYKIGDLTNTFVIKNNKRESKNKLKGKLKKYLAELNRNGFTWIKFINDLNGKAIYSPKVIVLTSTTTNSAAFHFLHSLHCLDKITVIGVAPKQAGNTFMESTSFELSKTKVKGSISNSYQILYNKDNPKSRIYTPNVQLTWKKLKELEFITNAELELALSYIKNKK